jgi:hypothetical protein
VLVAGYFSQSVVEKAVSRALHFWAAYDQIELRKPLSRSAVREFAKLFRRCLDAYCVNDAGVVDLTDSEANVAARCAVRELCGYSLRHLM